MATTAPEKWVVQAKVAESNATCSDHWPLSLGLLPRVPMRRVKPTGDRKAHRPIGWVLKELSYNDDIRERVGMELPVDVA